MPVSLRPECRFSLTRRGRRGGGRRQPGSGCVRRGSGRDLRRTAMQTTKHRSFERPDETRPFPHGRAEIVKISGTEIHRLVLEAGWRSSWTTAPSSSPAPVTSPPCPADTTPGSSATNRSWSSTGTGRATTPGSPAATKLPLSRRVADRHLYRPVGASGTPHRVEHAHRQRLLHARGHGDRQVELDVQPCRLGLDVAPRPAGQDPGAGEDRGGQPEDLPAQLTKGRVAGGFAGVHDAVIDAGGQPRLERVEGGRTVLDQRHPGPEGAARALLELGRSGGNTAAHEQGDIGMAG